MKIKKSLLPLTVALALASGAASAATVSVSQVNAQVAGGNVDIVADFTADGVTVAYQCDISVDPSLGTFTNVEGANPNGLCSILNGGATVRLLDGTPNNTPMTTAPTCNIILNVAAGSDGDVIPLTLGNCEFNNAAGDSTAGHTLVDGSVTLVAEGPPTITFDETAVALPAGVFGTTQTGSIAVTVTPGGGNVSTDTASYSCTAPAGFTVSPLTGGPIDNSGTLANLTVSAVLTNAAQSGNVECTATNTSGSDVDFTIPVSAPAGTEAAPVLGANPASGSAITFPSSVIGSTANTGITFTPTGGAGTLSATLSCSSDIFTVAPADLTFAVGSAAQSITASCAVTAAEQVATIDCVGTDGTGDISFTYDATCPAGVAISAPLYVPASSLWSKLAMFGIFAGLGLAVLGFRRNH